MHLSVSLVDQSHSQTTPLRVQNSLGMRLSFKERSTCHKAVIINTESEITA